MGKPSIAKPVVARVLVQERWIHPCDKNAIGQAVGETRAISFAIAFRALGIFRGIVTRLIDAGFSSHKKKSVGIEVLHCQLEFLAGG